MNEKEVVPSLDLDSKDFEKKVISSLKNARNVRINPKFIQNNEEGDMNKFAFALMNTQNSTMKICPVCDRKHYFFTNKAITEQKEGEKALCEICGIDLYNMVLFKVDKEKIEEWIKGNSRENSFDLIRDAIQRQVNSGEVDMQTGTLGGEQEDE